MLQRRLRDHYMAIWLTFCSARGCTNCCSIQPTARPAAPTPWHAATVRPVPVRLCWWWWAASVVLVACDAAGYSSRDPTIEILSREHTLQKIVSPLQQPVSRLHWPGSMPLGAERRDEDGVGGGRLDWRGTAFGRKRVCHSMNGYLTLI
ncbi:hypothetical protein [Kouleothrix sp.]|uniref:hypothetical protein n=1 Tax=Kouleothrix sp. TaxID=2779161 RepID=UPI00391964B0